MSAFYTASSFNYIEGDIVEVGIIHDGFVSTYSGTLLKPNLAIIPMDNAQVAIYNKRKFFVESEKLPEELSKYIMQGSDYPENYELYQVLGFDVKIEGRLPFKTIPVEYQAKNDGDIYIPLGLIRRRLTPENLGNIKQETTNINLGARCKATRYVRIDDNNMEINEIIGKIVGFEFTIFGGHNYIIKVNKASGSKIKKITNDVLHEDLFKAYPKADFVLVNNDYKIEFAPSKPDIWRKEYLNALRTILHIDGDKKLVMSKIKAIKLSKPEDIFDFGKDYWYAFTQDNHRIASDMQTLGVQLKENFIIKFGEGTSNPRQPRVGDVVFGFEPRNNKENECPNLVWFYSHDYPAFEIFYRFALTNGELFKSKDPKDCVEMFKNGEEETIYSKLIAGYFNPKVTYPEVKEFRKRYLWFM